ncbi:MAG: hypothetical protein JWM11_2263 [Planctomycetaceae bacterium]|nr:hypothetical protein [Planctomycetaceae bacterium]
MSADPPWEIDDRRRLECIHLGPRELRVGDHVILRPNSRADIFDLALNGMAATIVAIEQDFEDRVYLAVTVDADPGSDIGAAGKIAHRFFFGLHEVEPSEPPQKVDAAALGEAAP